MSYNCNWCGKSLPTSSENRPINCLQVGYFLSARWYCGNKCKSEGEANKVGNHPKQNDVREVVVKTPEQLLLEHQIDMERRATVEKSNEKFFADVVKYWKIWVPIALLVIGWFAYQNKNKPPETATTSAVQTANTEQIHSPVTPREEIATPVTKDTIEQASNAIETPPTASEEHNGVITVDKAYFHNEANADTKRKGYLIKGQEVTVSKSEGDYVYCTYKTETGSTTGWILKSDVK